MYILFVCTGNTCRSPMAAALLRHRVAEQGLAWTVDSAGIYATVGQPMASHATDVLISRHVVVPNHESKPITDDLVAKADWILTMTHGHKSDVLAQFPEALGKTHTLMEFTSGMESADDISDPFGAAATVYESCAGALDDAMENLIKRLT